MKSVNLILDTDAGSDCDDMMALAYLVYAMKHRNVKLRAVSYSNGCAYGIPAIRAFLRCYGAKVPPVGRASGAVGIYDHYCREIAERFSCAEDHANAEDAVTVLRRALCDSDRAVLCGIGPLTNIAALLQSPPDAISPLDGVALVREKCEKLVLMAGTFTEDAVTREPEWNAKLDAAATRTVVECSPVPIAFLPFETGAEMLTGGSVMQRYGDGDLLTLSFLRFPGVRNKGGRHSWDPAAVLYAVEGCGEYFNDSECGTVTVDAKGRTLLSKDTGGPHRVVRIKCRGEKSEHACKAAIAAYIDACAEEICEAFSAQRAIEGSIENEIE